MGRPHFPRPEGDFREGGGGGVGVVSRGKVAYSSKGEREGVRMGAACVFVPGSEVEE